jgi:dihydrofolate reductase
LPGRDNLVLSRRAGWTASGAKVVAGRAEALAAVAVSAAGADRADGPAWVIGGEQIYRLFEPVAGRAEVTVIDLAVEGDAHAPRLGAGWRRSGRQPGEGWLVSRTGLRYRFETWVREA